jgi:hypothetical protein
LCYPLRPLLIFYRGFHWTETLKVITDGIRSAGTIMLIPAPLKAWVSSGVDMQNQQDRRQGG